MHEVNWTAALVAALAAFAFGALWYAPFTFMNAWVKASGAPPPRPAPRVFATSFFLTLIAALVFAAWLGPKPPLGFAVMQGVLVGACLVAGSLGVNYLFSGRSHALWLIDGGFQTGRFALMGLVLGLWH